tara:strand:+ start:917 stop:1099 length:183 start_codon:yes stop_codon:yes gene_type:complete
MKVLFKGSGINSKIVKHLEESFPNVLPIDYITQDELAFLQGQQSVIAHCKRLLEEAQEEN